MKASFSINNQDLSYLIHGQYFRLDYKVSRCLFLIFYYDNGSSFFKRIYFKKNRGVFENVTNCYKPNLKIYALGFGIRIFKFKLKINFINSKPPEIFLKVDQAPASPSLNIRPLSPKLRVPVFYKKDHTTLRLLNNSIIINNYNDLDVFKIENSITTNI